MNKYRIDRSFSKVYEYSAEHNAYLFFASFAALNVTSRSRDKTILNAIEEAKDQSEYSNNGKETR